MKTNNLILKSDSYKYSHPPLYPDGTQTTHFYVEPRGGAYSDVVNCGQQFYLKEYLSKPISQENIDEARELLKLHGVPFYEEGWKHVLEKHDGFLPLKIRSVPEGMIVPNHNALMTIENTDPACWWLPSFIETLLLKVWYPITVASRSYAIRKMIMTALEESSDDPKAEIDFKTHSFGYRGTSSEESAGIGGFAETLCFKGSDTMNGIIFARDYYGSPCSSFSISALEHAITTAFGPEHEVECYRKALDLYAKPGALLACVSDTYDLWKCIENVWCGELKEQVKNSGATIVIRPDSGTPHEVVLKCLQMLDEGYGHTINSKGFKVLNHVRVIQGDGITDKSIPLILKTILDAGFSATNLNFGMGGGMLQQLDRDTLRFAMKLSAVQINGVWKDASKTPITDVNKKSKAGRLDLIRTSNGLETVVLGAGQTEHPDTVMRMIFENGRILVDENLETIRSRVLSA